MHTFARRRTRASVRRPAIILLCAALLPLNASAQEQITIRSDFLFYGDNTEFRNPFREGETIFGAAFRVTASFAERSRNRVCRRICQSAVWFGDRVRTSETGAFTDRSGPAIGVCVRYASATHERSPRRARPQWSPCIAPAAAARDARFRPSIRDRSAWTFNGSDLKHDFWLEWQRLNTPEHRERFDGGLRTSYRLSNHLTLPLQLHVVHEGGQLHQSGAVADSAAVAAGAIVVGTVAHRYAATLEVFAVGSRYVPDRSRPNLSKDGAAFFGRAAAERSGWRGHVIFWRGRNFIKDEGDLNYQSVTRSGDRYPGTRHYAEAGLTRRFTIARAAVLDVAGRLHRVEGRYQYLVPDPERRFGVLEDPLMRTPWHLGQKKLRRAR